MSALLILREQEIRYAAFVCNNTGARYTQRNTLARVSPLLQSDDRTKQYEAYDISTCLWGEVSADTSPGDSAAPLNIHSLLPGCFGGPGRETGPTNTRIWAQTDW